MHAYTAVQPVTTLDCTVVIHTTNNKAHQIWQQDPTPFQPQVQFSHYSTDVSPFITYPQVDSHHKSGGHHSTKWLEVCFVDAVLVNGVDEGTIGDEKEDQGRNDAFYDTPGKYTDVEQSVFQARQIQLGVTDAVSIINILNKASPFQFIFCKQYIVLNKGKCFFLFAGGGGVLLFYFAYQTLYCTVLQHNARSHTAHNTAQFLANNNIHNSPWEFQVAGLTPKRTHLERVRQVCLRQSQDRCKCVWIVSGTQAGTGGHPSASNLQPDPVHAWDMLSSYWFLRRTHPELVSLSVIQLQNTEQPNFFLDEKSVKIIDSDLSQLQNKIWSTWFLAEFSSKSKANQICTSFFFNHIFQLKLTVNKHF